MTNLSLTKTYTKYPQYKDSGVEWVGDVPEHWDVATSRRLFQTKKKLASETESQMVLSLTLQGVIPRVLDGSGKNPANYDTYQEFQKDDLVFCLFDYDVTPRTIGYVGENGMMTGAYTRLIPKSETSSKFFYYYFLYLDYTKELLHLCTGLRNSISKPVFWSLKNPLPPKEEQERIARFLDERTARIDEIIAKKERLIELLKEKRTAFINKAITSASGERVKLSQCLELNPSKRLAVGLEDAQEVSFVPMEALSDVGELSLQVRKYSDVRSGFTYFENGDVVLAKITPCFENGKAGVMRGLKNGFGFGTTEFVVMRPKHNMLSEYLYYVVYSDEFRQKGEVEMRGTAGQKRVSVTFLKNYQVNLPDLAQQRIIADTILEKMKRYQATEKKLVDSVTVLQEFKSSLISHAVTGKIRV